MKRVLYFLIIILLLGCQKIMHDEETQIAQISNTNEMDMALTGLYSRLSQYINTWPNYFGDDMQSYSWNKQNPGFLLAYSYLSDSQNSNERWQKLFKIVTSANNIICQFENKQNINKALKTGLGEAYLIRAYTYFRLVRIYNEAPVIKDINISYTIPKSTTKDIYAFIEKDLLKANALLPSDKASARVPNETPCRGTVKALLAEVYLTMGGYPLKDETKYSQAAIMASEVIDSATIFGFYLMPDYADLWNGNHKINNETMLALFFTQKGSSVYDLGNGYWSVNFNTEINNYTVLNVMMNPARTPFNIIPGWKFFNNYPDCYRKQATFQTILPHIIISTYDTITGGSAGIIVFNKHQFMDSTSLYNDDITFFYKKLGYSCSIQDTSFKLRFQDSSGFMSITQHLKSYYHLATDQPIYIYRYAHTLLTYAEAKARSGQLDASAYEALNMVRRRANKADINSPSKYDLMPGLSAIQFADSVVRERALEFCAEPEGRWYDLVRTEMVEQLPKLRGGGPAMGKDTYFAPIPSSDKALNPNLK